MVDIQGIIDHLKRHYPAPAIQQDWVRDCVSALLEVGQEPSISSVHEQYLYTDLSISSFPSLPPNVSSAHNTILFHTPTLLQIHSITEIASSAFQLQTVLAQRRVVLDGRTRIRSMDDEAEADEGEGGGDGVFEDGMLPVYPRGMLKLELGDGSGMIKAMEYTRISGLKLGETALGIKIIYGIGTGAPGQSPSRNVVRLTVLLTPENTKVVGGMVDALEAEQPTQFIESLDRRLSTGPIKANGLTKIKSKPKPRAITGSTGVHSGAAARRRDIATANSDTQTVTLSGRESKTSIFAPSQTSRVVASRQQSSTSNRNGLNRPLKGELRAEPDDGIVVTDRDDDAFGKDHGGDSQQRFRAIPGSDDYGDFDPDESFMRQVEQVERGGPSLEPVPRQNHRRGAEEEHDDDDDDEFGFEADDNFIRHVDEMEMIAAAGSSKSAKYRDSGGRGMGMTSSGMVHETRKRQRIVPGSGDAEDSEKENRPDIIEISD